MQEYDYEPELRKKVNCIYDSIVYRTSRFVEDIYPRIWQILRSEHPEQALKRSNLNLILALFASYFCAKDEQVQEELKRIKDI